MRGLRGRAPAGDFETAGSEINQMMGQIPSTPFLRSRIFLALFRLASLYFVQLPVHNLKLTRHFLMFLCDSPAFINEPTALFRQPIKFGL